MIQLVCGRRPGTRCTRNDEPWPGIESANPITALKSLYDSLARLRPDMRPMLKYGSAWPKAKVLVSLDIVEEQHGISNFQST